MKASNYFMPKETLSEKGPGGGGWILMNMQLAVKTRDNKIWGADHKGMPRIFAVGDCNYSCVEEPGKPPNQWPIPPMPKISYPGEEEAVIACGNLEKVDKVVFHNAKEDCCGSPSLSTTCTGLGAQACSQHPLVLMMLASLPAPIGRRTPATW